MYARSCVQQGLTDKYRTGKLPGTRVMNVGMGMRIIEIAKLTYERIIITTSNMQGLVWGEPELGHEDVDGKV